MTTRIDIADVIAQRAIGRLVEAPIGGDVAGRAEDRRRGLSELHDPPPRQEPDQTGLVVAAQAAVARVRRVRNLVQAEQVARGPAQHLGALTPGCNEAPAVLDSLLPAGDLDLVRAPSRKGFAGTTNTTETTKAPLLIPNAIPLVVFRRFGRTCKRILRASY